MPTTARRAVRARRASRRRSTLAAATVAALSVVLSMLSSRFLWPDDRWSDVAANVLGVNGAEQVECAVDVRCVARHRILDERGEGVEGVDAAAGGFTCAVVVEVPRQD